jgi:hypothetical protein
MLFTITFLSFLFVLFTTSTSHLIPRQLSQFQVCDSGKIYPISITTLTYAPNPIVPGQNLTLTLVGTTQVQVEQNSTLKIQGIVFSIPVKTFDVNFCDEVLAPNVSSDSQLCPIPAGNFNYDVSAIVPDKPELEALDGVTVRFTRKYLLYLKIFDFYISKFIY